MAGPAGDMFGRRGTLILALSLLLACTMALAALPTQTPVWLIQLLRFATGFAGDVAGPAAIALAVESCNTKSRVEIMFAIMFFNSMGYLIEAIGLSVFMPHFGESPEDSWRGMSLFAVGPALLSLPLVVALRESPSFLAVKGRTAECCDALNFMARCNGRPSFEEEDSTNNTSEIAKEAGPGLFDALAGILGSYFRLLLILLCAEASRSFFMSGSAYLCKDLFMMADSTLSASSLNIIASITPLVGIVMGSKFVYLGVRRVNLLFCMIASAACMILTSPVVRSSGSLLLPCVLLFKLSYGPVSACVSLMRVEAFPTEVRATAFAIVCVAGRILCMLGPVLIETLKGNSHADSWPEDKLNLYLCILALGATSCGTFSMLVHPKMGTGRKLQDFVVLKDGEVFNMLDEEEEEALLKEDDHFRSKGLNGIKRTNTYGSLMHTTGARGMPTKFGQGF